MKHIFLDTNIFLHFQDFETIDWLNEASVSCCKLTVPPIVVDELDEKKIGTNKLSNRARKVLNRFETLMETESVKIKENVFFEVLLNKPQRIIYEENELNFDEQDHRLIASIIEFRDLRAIDDIVLCTNDIGPRLRAKQFGIKALKLSDKYLLPNQESEEEKKLKKLEQENRTLKNRIPKLSLSFFNSKEFIQYQVSNIEENNFETFKSKKLHEVKTKYPYLQNVDPFKNPMAIITQSMFALTADQINSYNEKLDEFYVEYEIALDDILEYEIKKNLTFEITLTLNNMGNTPAEDIDIHVHFPDGFELFESDEIDNKIDLPEPPYKPKNGLGFGYSPIMSYPSINPLVNFGGNMKLNSPTIKKTNSYDVDFHRKNLKHGYNEELESLSVVFENFLEIKNFMIEYEISAGNMPDKIKGHLNVIFKQ